MSRRLALALASMWLATSAAMASHNGSPMPATTPAAQGEVFTWHVEGTCIHVQFYTPSTVRVVKYPEATAAPDPLRRTSMVVTAAPQQVSVVRKGNTLRSHELTVSVDPKSGRLSFATHAGRQLLSERSTRFCVDDGRFRVDGTPKQGTARGVAQTFNLKKDEPIYGLGTIQDGRLNRRGTHIMMEQQNLQDFQNVVQGLGGWGIFWDNYSRTLFDDDPRQGMTLTSEVGSAADYYFIYGGSTDGVVAQMRLISGQVPMFPLWTYGYWQSKERYKSSRELLEVVDRYRELGVPLDGIIQDWQYWGSNYLWNAMDFLTEEFADGKRLADDVHSRNAHLMVSIWASFGPNTKAYRQLNEKGLLFGFQTWPQSGLTFWPPRMDYPSGVRVYDAFSDEARRIYWQNLKTLYDYGVDGWWMDSTDPDFFNPTEADYDQKAGDDGHTWRSLRNAFPLATVGGVFQAHRHEQSGKPAKEQKRVFIMTRSAFAGQQRYGSNMWSGDVVSSWDMLRKQVPAGLNFSLTGNPNFNTDIGGFFCNSYNTAGPASAPRNPQFQELYVRWMQYALFCPVFRSHGADAPREIWQFGEKGEPVYDAIEQAILLRYRLLPHLYSMAWQVSSNGESYLRPVVADFPHDRLTHDMADEFLFGRSILAAPVLNAQYTDENPRSKDTQQDATPAFSSARTVTKYLPKGADWYDFWTGTRHKGGQHVTLDTRLDRVPMFVRAGSIIPLGPPMQYVGEKTWEELELHVYPGADATYILYEDEGDNYNYEHGVYTTIAFRWSDASRTLTIGKRTGSFPGMLMSRTFHIILPDGQKKTVNYNGEEQSCRF